MSSFASRFESTLAVRGGEEAFRPECGAIVPPLFQVTSFARASLSQPVDHSYSRVSNPSVEALEARLAALERLPFALCTSSGMAALTTLCFSLLKAGDHVLCSRACYGGSARLIEQVLVRFGVSSKFLDLGDFDALEKALEKKPALLLVESPGNPTLDVVDLAEVSERAHAHAALVVVDNTFLTAFLQRPAELGADVVLYSTTKFIDGHNAAIGGALLCGDAEVQERLAWGRKAMGTIQKPFDAWLTLQGVKTLALRLRVQSANAFTLAGWLEEQEEVEQVYYPWLESNPNHGVARRQQRGGGGVLSFRLRGGRRAAEAFASALRLVLLAENLGSVESLITHPASMTHADVPEERRAALGLDEGLLRLSVGVEDPIDLMSDVKSAIAAVAKLNRKQGEVA